MGKRRVVTPEELEATEDEIWLKRDKPYCFTHNELYQNWWVWKCNGCGMVRLEDRATEFEAWLCEVCRVKFFSR